MVFQIVLRDPLLYLITKGCTVIFKPVDKGRPRNRSKRIEKMNYLYKTEDDAIPHKKFSADLFIKISIPS